jgi:hypothetical protein
MHFRVKNTFKNNRYFTPEHSINNKRERERTFYKLVTILNFFFWSKAVFVSWKVVSEKLLFKLSCIYLSLEKLVNKKHFPIKEKFGLVSRKVFSFYFWRKTLPKVVKNLEMSYYLLIISNLVLKLLITIYILF